MPGRHANFHVDPRVGPSAEELRGQAIGFASSFLCSARHRRHHPAVPATAHGKSAGRKRPAKLTRFLVLRIVLSRPRTPKYRDDPFFFHRINARVCLRGWRVPGGQIPQSSLGTIHLVHPTLHGSSRPDCCLGTKKSAADRLPYPQNPNACAHAPPPPSSHGFVPCWAYSSSMFPASRRPRPPAATQSTAQTTADPARTSTALRSPLA